MKKVTVRNSATQKRRHAAQRRRSPFLRAHVKVEAGGEGHSGNQRALLCLMLALELEPAVCGGLRLGDVSLA
jgi:hypothetical protein